MITFESDYAEGAHPDVLKRLTETNLEQQSGYGMDDYCASAREKIRKACECPKAQIEFLVGGTQTNALIIHSMLPSYEGVVAADTGHISVHEAGAIEYTGRKVITIPGHQGKIHVNELRTSLERFWQDDNREHMVFPGMVYISHPTEYGTLYNSQELAEISQLCQEYSIPLYMDGARLGYGLMSDDTDVTLPQIAQYCDVFYIGGTKVGALCGEAVVFTRENRPAHFVHAMKKHGALLAKGRLLGVQFDTLFTDDLYFQISKHAICMANQLKAGLQKLGYTMFLDSPTNQQFVVMSHDQINRLKTRFGYGYWETLDADRVVIRLATSWATKEENVGQLLEYLKEIQYKI